jgi:hypothetical protein
MLKPKTFFYSAQSWFHLGRGGEVVSAYGMIGFIKQMAVTFVSCPFASS